MKLSAKAEELAATNTQLRISKFFKGTPLNRVLTAWMGSRCLIHRFADLVRRGHQSTRWMSIARMTFIRSFFGDVPNGARTPNRLLCGGVQKNVARTRLTVERRLQQLPATSWPFSIIANKGVYSCRTCPMCRHLRAQSVHLVRRRVLEEG